MKSHNKNLDLNKVDWAEIGDMVCAIIANVKDNQRVFQEAAAARGTTLESLLAAAITEMLKDHLEKHAAK